MRCAILESRTRMSTKRLKDWRWSKILSFKNKKKENSMNEVSRLPLISEQIIKILVSITHKINIDHRRLA